MLRKPDEQEESQVYKSQLLKTIVNLTNSIALNKIIIL